MNLWLRLLWLFLSAPWRQGIQIPKDASHLQFRVMPHDLDISLHMNNGRYLTIMDLGRLDLLIRSGLARHVFRQRWTPVVNAAMVRFRRELRAFDRYRLETRIVGWSEQAVLLEQTFVFAAGDRSGQVAARALFKGAIYDRKQARYVPVAELMRLADANGESPPPSDEITAFLSADRAMREAGRSQGPTQDSSTR